MIKYFFKWNFSIFVALLFCSCNSTPAESDTETPEVRTPVTVTSVAYQPLEDAIVLNATSTYLQRDFVKSNLNGYIQKAEIKFGDYVHKGQILFVLKTKEAQAIGNEVNQLDPNFKFSGINTIHAEATGYVAEINHQAGDYVQDGEQLAVINDSKSFVFTMNVPYQYIQFAKVGKQVQLTLPDGEQLMATVKSSLPVMDSVSQTQSVSLSIQSLHTIPMNLIATAKIIKSSKPAAAVIDKKAVLSDESLNEFWVMKMINDSIAIKVPVKTGIETGDKIEIDSPLFSNNDKILLTGNYGLGDTALVKVQGE
ncbi:MAG: efflux RND transporter periplasmic adaptor subunit [Bacteroidetes bacterium]|nr:efflux RND transporter periplasmic adaptor subunit [Bacteroidota bacterium]